MANDEPLAAELDRNLWLCADCGSLYIVNWEVYTENDDDCDECLPTVRGATTEAVALELTGWSEERLLREAYVVATEVDRIHPPMGRRPLRRGGRAQAGDPAARSRRGAHYGAGQGEAG